MFLRIYEVIIQKTMSPQNSEEDIMIKFCKSWGRTEAVTDVLQNKYS